MQIYCAMILGVFQLVIVPLAAAWEPAACWIGGNVSVLAEESYDQLKSRMTTLLKGSWCSYDKMALLMDVVLMEKPRICVEVGAFTGSSVLPVAAALSYLGSGTVYAIDAWSNAVAIRNMKEKDPNKLWWSTVSMSDAKYCFKALMKAGGVSDYVKPIPALSEEAVSRFDTIDFLHLDGDYSQEGALRDVQLYLPKLKNGGYVLLSNICATKLFALYELFEACDIVIEIDSGATMLLRKNQDGSITHRLGS